MATDLQHPQVLQYMRELDQALTALPAQGAAELREQITAHLSDALAPDADDVLVEAVLHDLGRPNELVAEAVGPVDESPQPPLPRPRPRRPNKTMWIIVLVIAFSGTAAGAAARPWWKAAPMNVVGTAWVGADATAAVETSAAGHTQSAVRMRRGSVQGLYLQLQNRTRFTQTVLGLAPRGDGPIGPFGATKYSLDFFPEGDPRRGFVIEGLTPSNRLPISIKPGGLRIMRLTVATSSLPCYVPGTGVFEDSISLGVRVGWFTRTETISLNVTYELEGPNCS
ncbi:MAG: hypothetical protein M3Y44_12895 [Actinomycetota bacterium]|nr:hypothetical protein [Actinomycetota bacterium]